LGGSIEPRPGFQLFLTERGGNNSSEIAKIAQVRSEGWVAVFRGTDGVHGGVA
jgi:hypothetical protein